MCQLCGVLMSFAGNEFYIGELPHDVVMLQRDQPLAESANMPADSVTEHDKGLVYYKQYRYCQSGIYSYLFAHNVTLLQTIFLPRQ